MTTALPLSAQTVIYENNYENQNVGTNLDEAWKKTNWLDYNKLTPMSIEEDATHGKYVKMQPRTGNKGTGTGLFRFRDLEGASETTDPLGLEAKGITKYSLEFDAALCVTAKIIEKPAGSGTFALQGCNSEIGIVNSAAVFPKRFDYGLCYDNGADNEWNNIMFLKTDNTQEITATEEDDNYTADFGYLNMDVEGTPKVNIPVDGTWSHFKFDVDTEAMTVAWTITPENGTPVSGNFASIAENLTLYGIYFRVSAGDSDRDFVKIDNIKVTEGTPSGIENVTVDANEADDSYYTLSGVRVNKPTKGIYIHKGKKIIVTK